MNPWIRDPDEFSEVDQLEADHQILFRTIGPQDHNQYFLSAFEYIKHRALIAYRKETNSYRGFKVELTS